MIAENKQTHPRLLEMAIQTILHKNLIKLSHLADERNPELFRDMAREITYKALTLQQITENVVMEMESLHRHAGRPGDAKR